MDLFKPNVQKLHEKKDVRGLIKALSYKDPEVRDMACRVLGMLGDESAVEPLITALKDKDERVRHDAAYALGSLGDPRAATALLTALPDKSTFSVVTHALAKLKEPRLFDLLVPVLHDEALCSQAADALGELGDLRAVEPLVEVLNRQEPQARRNAALALGKLGDAQAAGALREALKDTDGIVRKFAIDSLCKLPGGLDKETLIRLLHDPEIQVRETAAYCLWRIGVPEEPEEQAWYAAARGEWEMAVKLGTIAAEPLFLATQTENMVKRVGAAAALARLGDRRAVEPLISCLSFAFSKPEVYVRAAEALGKYGDLRAVKPLQEHCTQWYEASVRQVAFRALSELERRLDRISTQQPVCFCCGGGIAALKSTIADDIRRSGGIASGLGLEQELFEGVICRTCGRFFCIKCHDPGEKGYNCPVCKHELSPLFIDYLLG